MATPIIIERNIEFNGNALPPEFTSHITKTAGNPTVGNVNVGSSNGGGCDLALDSTTEVQVLRLSFGDVLSLVATKLVAMEWWARVSASLASQCNLFMGVGNAGNDTVSSITQRCGFKMTGGGNLTCDAVDGTNSQTAIATGIPMLTTDWQKFSLNFKEGHITQGPPTSNVGGVGNLNDVIFRVENNLQGILRPVCQRTQMSLGALTSANGLQPIFQIGKSSNAATGTLSIKGLRLVYQR